jgi:hypothetical protein
MEYESNRTIAEIKIEDARSKAMKDASAYNLTGDIPDPNWAQPVALNELAGASLDQTQNEWMSKVTNAINHTFKHDLETLAANGPTDLPETPVSLPKMTVDEIEKRMDEYMEVAVPSGNFTTASTQMAKDLNISLEKFSETVKVGLFSPSVLAKAIPSLRGGSV